MGDAAAWTEKVLGVFKLLSGSIAEEVNLIQLAKVVSGAISSLPEKSTVTDEFFAIEEAVAKNAALIFVGKGWFSQLALTALYVVRMTHGS